jgi:glycosyltransferase involved in cell wall biosynthesis
VLTRADADTAPHQPSVCVVMAAFKAEATLEAAARSVLQQDVDSLTLAISVYPDDEATKSAAAALADPRVVIVERDGHGIANARNSAIREVDADLYAFLDSDDKYRPGVLKRYLADRVENPGLALQYGDWTAVSPRGGEAQERKVYVPRRSQWAQLLVWNFIATGTVMVNAEILADVGGFNEEYPHAEDWDLWLRIARKYPVRHVPIDALEYRRTKLARLYPRTFWMNEAHIARTQGGSAPIARTAVAAARGRYGLYWLATVRLRRGRELYDVRPLDLALSAPMLALRGFRRLAR